MGTYLDIAKRIRQRRASDEPVPSTLDRTEDDSSRADHSPLAESLSVSAKPTDQRRPAAVTKTGPNYEERRHFEYLAR